MPSYRSVGTVPPRRHTRSGAFAPDAEPALPWFEELVGVEGFSGASSLAYHRRSPSALLDVQAIDVPAADLQPNRPLLPRHLRPAALPCGGEPVLGRVRLAANPHVALSWWAGGPTTSPLTRSAAGDEVVFVQEGSVRLETALGALDLRPGHLCTIPATTVHRLVVAEGAQLLFVEALGGHAEVPERYLTRQGQLLEGSPYDERAILAPTAPLLAEDLGIEAGAPVEVVVRGRGGPSCHVHATHPFDVIGWDGFLYPWALHVDDVCPIVGRSHQPPPVHQLLAGPRFVLCAFVPRPLDWGGGAVAVPYHHANVDSDEVLFYSRGSFTSRAGTGVGRCSLTLHPAGFTHGPQRPVTGPAPVEGAPPAWTDEVAIMVDTFEPLELTAEALGCDDPGYWRTWQGTS